MPFGALMGFRTLASEAAQTRWLATLAGAMLAFGGLYQFGRWKTVCLRACRNPLGFVLSHDFGGGATSACRAGVSHGAYCLGCCWALMTLLVVVGLMNLVWMAVLTLLFFAQKNWRHGIRLGRLAGTALLALGIAVMVHPALLARVADRKGPELGSLEQPYQVAATPCA